MGVTGLWTVVQPCARPIKIETLNRKRLAVDASIWIYAFLKAVRDKEGNALRNSHVVGFYRRICKLLYIGILPVFVFDGGAPALKRQTISGRKQRREGRREDAVRTAGKLLAVQMQRRAEEEDQRRRQAAARPAEREEEEVPDNPVYVDELQMTQQERQQNRKFKKKDQYHLPDLDVSLAEMGQPNDPRVMSLEELENYARQFDSGEDINVYDFSKIDFNSPFFQSLPPSDRYNILNAARLRSRLRMGLSKDQLDNMFPDRMAFSRFQIERVKERNELTQRLMHVNGMGDDPAFGMNGTGRVAGEKGREYVLVKNAGVEGGWALGVIGDRETGERDKPIDVDEISKRLEEKEESEDDEDEEEAFEDVPIEGLNRLPKLSEDRNIQRQEQANRSESSDIMAKRNALYQSRSNQAAKISSGISAAEDSDSLFIGEAPRQEAVESDDEAELQRAIAMSLENDGRVSSPEANDEEIFNQLDPNSNGLKGALDIPNNVDNSDDEAEMEFENVLGGPLPSDRPPEPNLEQLRPASSKIGGEHDNSSRSQPQKFDGPLPFEKLDLGSSILGKKKMKKLEEDSAGGFQKKVDKEPKTQSTTLPPWFSGDLKEGIQAQSNIEKEYRERDRAAAHEDQFIFQEKTELLKADPSEVIDVDALEKKKDNVIDIESSEDEAVEHEDADFKGQDTEVEVDRLSTQQSVAEGLEKEKLKSSQPNRDEPTQTTASSPRPENVEESEGEIYEWEDSDQESSRLAAHDKKQDLVQRSIQPSPSKSTSAEFEDVDMVNARHDDAVNASFVSDVNVTTSAPDVVDEAAPLLDDSDDDMYGSDAEDEELMLQMATETEEHERFASTLNNNAPRQTVEEYERELKSLRSQQKKDRRDADEVTHVMITECQQLLKLFGLPYITAPMEAEAQCAELVNLGLVDGIVTDDSDIFLFGGTRIYKNMFNQAKFVECYLSSDLEREFDLTRDKMIRIAHLLGSDYTEGVPGVGPVTALEIISEFPAGLDAFKEWWTRVQTGARPTEQDPDSAFCRKFRRNSTRLFLPQTFPDKRVDHAYWHPDVDSDPSAFQWGVPDLDALRSFLMATVGWSQERTDEVLVPVIRDMNRRENEGTQVNITRFMGGAAGAGAGAFAPRRNDRGKSKRMEGALEKLAARARARRKAAAGGARESAGEVVDLAAEQDRAVQADEEVIALPGSAVGGDTVSAERQNGKGQSKASSKRKAAPASSDQGESEDQDSGEVPAKRKKPKKNPSKKAKRAA